MTKGSQSVPAVLTVAGSDSGGGAGVQADLKTFHSLGVFGTCVITCLTAQNPRRVSRVETVLPRMVVEQMERVLEAFPVRAMKTGMLYDAAIIRAVASVVSRWQPGTLVVDPVMAATCGARLLKGNAVKAMTEELFPLASVVTPNRREAEVLWGNPIRNLRDQHAAAEWLARRYGVAFVVKGGHLPGAVDVLHDGRRAQEFSAGWVRGAKTHGTGCVFSAAITAYLALGCSLVEAVGRAKRFITDAIRCRRRVGRFLVLKV